MYTLCDSSDEGQFYVTTYTIIKYRNILHFICNDKMIWICQPNNI